MIYNQINESVPVKRLGQDNDKKIYNPVRSHIGMSFQPVAHDMESRIKAIVEYIKEKNIRFEYSRMLVFCKTRNQCEDLAATLPSLLVKEGVLQEGMLLTVWDISMRVWTQMTETMLIND